MATSAAQAEISPTASAVDLSAAYRLSQLSRFGISHHQALTNRAIYIALRCTALAIQRRKQQEAL